MRIREAKVGALEIRIPAERRSIFSANNDAARCSFLLCSPLLNWSRQIQASSA